MRLIRALLVRRRRILLLALILLAATPIALAQTGLVLDWWTIDAGGGTSTGGGFTLTGTSGQPDAGALAGGGFTLTGGFWNEATGGVHMLYLPATLRNSG